MEMGSSTESSTPLVSGCGAGGVAQATRGPSEPPGPAAPGRGRGLFPGTGWEHGGDEQPWSQAWRLCCGPSEPVLFHVGSSSTLCGPEQGIVVIQTPAVGLETPCKEFS